MVINFNQLIVPVESVLKNNIEFMTSIVQEQKDENSEWRISIDCIGLDAQIHDGVDSGTLDKYVGHFTQSAYTFGNVALAAHNRGYPVNYFKNIKRLQVGDVIEYEYKNLKLRYTVYNNVVIKDTDTYVVENTKENTITLITCVENEPELRRCVQGKLKMNYLEENK